MADNTVKFVIHIEKVIDDKKIDEKIDKKIEKKIEKKIDEKIEKKINKKTDEKLDEKINKKLEKKLQKKLTSSKSPIQSEKLETRGGIFGKADVSQVSFKKAKAIGGGVQRLRSDRSKAPFQSEKWLEQIKRIEKGISENKISTKSIEKVIGTHMKPLLQGASGLIKDPESFIANKLLSTISKAGPHGALIAAIVSAIVAGPLLMELAKYIIMAMSVKGGMLNRDFLINVEDAVTGFLSYTDQHKRDIGLSGFIVSSTDGYGGISGTNTYNSLLEKDEARITRIPQEER